MFGNEDDAARSRKVTLVLRREDFDKSFYCGYVTIRDMKFPYLPARNKPLGKLSKQDEQVFDQAKELASLRLEQCIADLRICGPTVKDDSQRPLRKLDLL